ncbi:MAG: hypothetical protein Q7T00_09820 [Rugosibacter sp.]|jgi:hypothetical protein|nr:hypothetical protein [Rugosibacter sp.]
MQTRDQYLPTGSPRSALEAIDHLTKKICALWGTPELNLFIRHLIMDSRNGSRQGLPMEIAAEMVFLAETNTFVRAIKSAKLLNIKFSEALKTIEAEDNQPLKLDVFDDPFVSHDTLTDKEGRERFNPVAIAPVPRYAQQRTPAKSPTAGLLALLLMLFRNRWLWVIALAVTGYHFVWPWMQPLL